MSSVKELEEKVNELLKKIETLKQKEKVKELEYPFEIGEKCWFINSSGSLFQDTWDTAQISFDRYSQGNIFKTKEDAEREHDKRALLTRFRQFRDKCNGEWKPDWINSQEYKYFMRYFSGCKSCDVTYCVHGDLFSSFGYFKNEDDCKRAIELFGDEIKRLFVEE